MKQFTICLVLLFIFLTSYKVSPSIEGKVNWIKFSDLPGKMSLAKKPVIIDMYTDWCHWCKVMDKETYQNKKVAEYINENFYAVSFNAESKEPVTWRSKAYKYDDSYKINELAITLSNGQLSFPTTIIIPDDNSGPIPIAGLLKPREIESIVRYFGSGANKKESFPEFQKSFHASW